jgi:hypothetical protein
VNTGRSAARIGAVSVITATTTNYGDRPISRQIRIVARSNDLPARLDTVGGEDARVDVSSHHHAVYSLQTLF